MSSYYYKFNELNSRYMDIKSRDIGLDPIPSRPRTTVISPSNREDLLFNSWLHARNGGLYNWVDRGDIIEQLKTNEDFKKVLRESDPTKIYPFIFIISCSKHVYLFDIVITKNNLVLNQLFCDSNLHTTSIRLKSIKKDNLVISGWNNFNDRVKKYLVGPSTRYDSLLSSIEPVVIERSISNFYKFYIGQKRLVF